MITRPLNLESRLSPPPRDLNAVAWVNVGVVVLFFSLLGSRFVLAPGVLVGTGGAGVVELPVVNASSMTAVATSVVVTYRRDNVILFQGGMYSLAELQKHMEVYAKKHPGSVLQVNADKQVSMQAWADLCAMAGAAGFANVILVAAEPDAAEKPSN
ncbi:MAG TPA: biopolymer transporter ExbD [Lacunisphaera sp.]|nr:biopolymer transporter ExbD [Lacunisphaera sp.]